jgi:hypothetical protein
MTDGTISVITWQEIVAPGVYVKGDKRIRIEFDGEYYTLARWSNNSNAWQWIPLDKAGNVRTWKTLSGVIRYVSDKLYTSKVTP